MIKEKLTLKQIAARLDRGAKALPEGFRRISDRVPVYASRSRGIIIKRGNFLLDTPPKALRVPTRRIAGTDWVVQPMVARIFLRAAVRAIRSKLPAGCMTDLHTGNVGWLDGRPVMFDW